MNVEPVHKNSLSSTTATSATPPGEIINLQVAGRTFARSRFVPEGKTSPAILPTDAINILESMLSEGVTISEVQISGPGDPLADMTRTVETLHKVHDKHVNLRLSISTLGLHGDQHAKMLADCGVSFITLLIDAIDPEVIKNLYLWIRPGTKTVPLSQASFLLADEQLRAIPAMVQAGMTVIVKTTVYPGINDNHIPALAEVISQLGAKRMILVPCSSFTDEKSIMSPPDSIVMLNLCEIAGRHLPTVIAGDNPAQQESTTGNALSPAAAMLPKPTKDRPNVAVVSSNGMDIDLHLGQAVKALVYGPREDGLVCLLSIRSLPEAGGGPKRWETIASTFSDCFALLAAGAGETPRTILSHHGITTLTTEGEVDGMVDVLYGGGKKGKQCRTEQRK